MQISASQNSPPVVLSIAGSDNSAGAGIQADLKTFSALGTYGLTAVTCVVAEVPGVVESVMPVTPALLASQIALSFEAFPVAAVKTGMLYSRELIAATVRELHKASAGRDADIPLVVDPVMVASSGDPLLQDDAVDLYRTELFPLATVITPNLDEAGALLDRPIRSVGEMHRAAADLHGEYGCAVLLKGGHLEADVATDVLFDGEACEELHAPFRHGVSTHGTGCTYAAAIAAGLAKGESLAQATRNAKAHVTAAIEGIFEWRASGGTTMALRH